MRLGWVVALSIAAMLAATERCQAQSATGTTPPSKAVHERRAIDEIYQLDLGALMLPPQSFSLDQSLELLVNPALRDPEKARALLQSSATFADGSHGEALKPIIIDRLVKDSGGSTLIADFLHDVTKKVADLIFKQTLSFLGSNLADILPKVRVSQFLLLTSDVRLRKAVGGTQLEACVLLKLWRIQLDNARVAKAELFFEDLAIGRTQLRPEAFDNAETFDVKKALVPALIDAFQGKLAASLWSSPKLRDSIGPRDKVPAANLLTGAPSPP